MYEKNNEKSLISNIKNLLIMKNMLFILLILIAILLIGSVFRYIYLQNIQYQKSNEESVIEQQEETKTEIETENREEEEMLSEKEAPDVGQQSGKVEREYRDDTLMIF